MVRWRLLLLLPLLGGCLDWERFERRPDATLPDDASRPRDARPARFPLMRVSTLFFQAKPPRDERALRREAVDFFG